MITITDSNHIIWSPFASLHKLTVGRARIRWRSMKRTQGPYHQRFSKCSMSNARCNLLGSAAGYFTGIVQS